LPVPPTAPKITVVSAAGSPGPLSGVSIPTAPRSQRSDAKLSRPHGIATSAQWVNPDIAKKGLSKPKEIAKSPSKTPSPTEISAPAPQLASNASPEAHTNQSTELASKESAPLLGSSLVTTEHKSEIPKSKRRPILIRHPPRPTAKDSPLDIDDGSDDSDADSVDSIGRGDFFEEDIEKLEDKISKLPKNLEETEPLHLPQLAKLMDLPLPASDDKKELQLWEQELEYRKKQRQKKYDQQLLAVNTLGPASEPDAHFLTPFINTLIDSQTLARHCALLQPTVSAECESAKVQKAATPPPIIKDSLAAPPQTKGRSRPTTPRIDTKTFTKPLINGKDDISGLGPQTSTPGPAPSIETADEPIFEMQGVPAAIGIEEVPNGQDHGNSATAQPIANGSRPEAKPMMEVPDESEDEQSAEERIEQLEAVRKVMKTPQLSSLPKFNVKRWDQDEEFLKTLEPDPVVEEHLKKKRAEIQARREREQREEQERWSERYYEYRKWTDFSNHPIAVRSRQKFAKAREAAAAEAASLKVSTPAPGSKPESSRRTGRWATEHDFERVLRESEQEANEAKEREERVARARTASAKEATIPAMCWDQEQWEETSYIDKTHLVPFERSFAILEFGEPIDNFTEEENEIFEKAYLEFPKQWGKIAEALPDRDYKACIQHYYLVKHGSGIKEKLKKQGRKRGRAKNPPKGAKPKSNALMADIVSRDDGEDGQDTENGERRRPRRAAAPTFAFEATPGDSEAASPAPTPGRKAAAPKGENSNDAPPKRKTKTPREKTSKQAKNSQLLAAAPTPTSPAVPALSVRRESASSNRFPPQYDGAAGMSTNFSPPTYTPVERPSPSINLSYEQPYNVPERLDSATPMSATPMSFDSQDRRSLQQQTSSYWSVPEQTEFPALLRYFGTDWNGIARHMTSKTHIMVYTTVFQQWLAVPTDTNKSRRVANIQAQVKNYYQRQIDSGKMTEWEVIARDADDKRRRGEDTGPIPNPIVIPKGRTSGPMPRAGPMLEGTDDMSPGGQNMMLQQASPTQPSLSSRFPAIAQAGPVPQTLSQPGTPTTSLLSKHLPPQQPTQHAPPQLQQQARSRGGPALGYFNPDPQRSMLQASVQPQSTPPLQESVSQRSVMVAKEAHLERLQALKLEREQAALQQQQSLQQQQQHAIQKERQLQMKQENDLPNLQQYEPYSNPSPHPNVLANSRNDNLNPMALPEARRTAPPPLQYQNRNPQVRSLLTENLSGGREIKSSPSPAVPRAPMSAPPAGQEPYNAPPAPPPSQPPPARQPEPKRSNISSLLNDEPAEPAQPTPPTRINNLASATLQTSHTPPPQHISQPPRYAPHPSQSTSQSMSHQLAPHLSQQHQPSQIAYAPSPVHSSHQPSSVGPSRTYTPNNFDSRAYGAPPSMQQQQQQHQQPSMYSQPPRQSMVPQPPPIRRESSLGEGHSLAGGYARSSAPSQTSMRLKESPYSATPAPAPPQAARQQIGSPHDLALPDREYYSQQYRMQQPSTTAGSPPRTFIPRSTTTNIRSSPACIWRSFTHSVTTNSICLAAPAGSSSIAPQQHRCWPPVSHCRHICACFIASRVCSSTTASGLIIVNAISTTNPPSGSP